MESASIIEETPEKISIEDEILIPEEILIPTSIIEENIDEISVLDVPKNIKEVVSSIPVAYVIRNTSILEEDTSFITCVVSNSGLVSRCRIPVEMIATHGLFSILLGSGGSQKSVVSDSLNTKTTESYVKTNE